MKQPAGANKVINNTKVKYQGASSHNAPATKPGHGAGVDKRPVPGRAAAVGGVQNSVVGHNPVGVGGGMGAGGGDVLTEYDRMMF